MNQARHFDLAFEPPKGWADRSSVLFVGPAQFDYAPNIIVVQKTLPAPKTSRDFAIDELDGLRKAAGGEAFHLVEEENILLAAHPAFRRVYECVYPGIGGDLTQMQVYLVRGTLATTITATTLTSRYSELEPVFIEMIAGMKITQPPPRPDAPR